MKATAFLAENPQHIHENCEDSDDRDQCHNAEDHVAKAQKPPEARDVSALVNDPRFHNYFADGLPSVEQEIPMQYQEPTSCPNVCVTPISNRPISNMMGIQMTKMIVVSIKLPPSRFHRLAIFRVASLISASCFWGTVPLYVVCVVLSWQKPVRDNAYEHQTTYRRSPEEFDVSAEHRFIDSEETFTPDDDVADALEDRQHRDSPQKLRDGCHPIRRKYHRKPKKGRTSEKLQSGLYLQGVQLCSRASTRDVSVSKTPTLMTSSGWNG